MALFNKNDGGFMDVIRCDEADYLIWKWHPQGSDAETSQRANQIRWGSSLRVKEGSVAVFQYPNTQDALEFFEGPYDKLIETENFPILANVIGMAYNGGSPFQAEVYFINLAGLVKMGFGVPKTKVVDFDYNDFSVDVFSRGEINFNISDYHKFIEKNTLRAFDIDLLKEKVRSSIQREVASVLHQAPIEYRVGVLQIDSKREEINNEVDSRLKEVLYDEYGITVTRVDITAIEVDENSEDYKKLKKKQQGGMKVFAKSAGDLIGAIGETKVKVQAKKDALSDKYGVNLSEKKDHVGKAVSNLFTSAVNGVKQVTKNAPPPIPSYHVVIEGKQDGPFDAYKLSTMISEGKMGKDTLVWTNGMKEWEKAGDKLPELFDSEISQVPPIPPVGE
ncbi:SPFH domain-containing protein [Butyrivibrio sp. MC2021]|uniref:SPFH domain-containing protein n=1 Tax=Butyrivibrio sp. MC2021 TaxID=1408306 RepID=UPI00047C3F91|nr:SPFH domain-containing protein [Butyrivibrio sp. MC2021]